MNSQIRISISAILFSVDYNTLFWPKTAQSALLLKECNPLKILPQNLQNLETEFLASLSFTSDVFVSENNAKHNLARFLPASALEQG